MPFVQEHLNIFLKNIPEGPQESIGEVPSVWLEVTITGEK